MPNHYISLALFFNEILNQNFIKNQFIFNFGQIFLITPPFSKINIINLILNKRIKV